MKCIHFSVGRRLRLLLLLLCLATGGGADSRHPVRDLLPQPEICQRLDLDARSKEASRPPYRSAQSLNWPAYTSTPDSSQNPCNAKRVTNGTSFSVDSNAMPFGKIGDVDDVTIGKEPELVRFKYTTSGKGSHEWDYKYEAAVLNPNPAQFAGVMYLDPDSDFGTRCAGYDLTGMRVVTWKARSVGQGAVVEFRIGGLKWIWDSQRRVKVDPPYPDSLPSMSLGVRKLDNKWRAFRLKLPNYPDAYFSRVINVFSWVLTWRSNHVALDKDRTAPARPRTFKIEIKDISYSAK
jgi:hypothetical protein